MTQFEISHREEWPCAGVAGWRWRLVRRHSGEVIAVAPASYPSEARARQEAARARIAMRIAGMGPLRIKVKR